MSWWAHMGPCGPIWSPYRSIWIHMGPYGPMARMGSYGVHMGPHGSTRAHMDPNDESMIFLLSSESSVALGFLCLCAHCANSHCPWAGYLISAHKEWHISHANTNLWYNTQLHLSENGTSLIKQMLKNQLHLSEDDDIDNRNTNKCSSTDYIYQRLALFFYQVYHSLINVIGSCLGGTERAVKETHWALGNFMSFGQVPISEDGTSLIQILKNQLHVSENGTSWYNISDKHLG